MLSQCSSLLIVQIVNCDSNSLQPHTMFFCVLFFFFQYPASYLMGFCFILFFPSFLASSSSLHIAFGFILFFPTVLFFCVPDSHMAFCFICVLPFTYPQVFCSSLPVLHIFFLPYTHLFYLRSSLYMPKSFLFFPTCCIRVLPFIQLFVSLEIYDLSCVLPSTHPKVFCSSLTVLCAFFPLHTPKLSVPPYLFYKCSSLHVP